MAPRDGSEAEDDGYLITFTSDVANDMSEFLILDAARPPTTHSPEFGYPKGSPAARARHGPRSANSEQDTRPEPHEEQICDTCDHVQADRFIGPGERAVDRGLQRW
jgi:hypothetical protein